MSWINLKPGKIKPSTAFNLEDLLVMARTIYGEARGELFTGKKAVGHVILNRVKGNNYGNLISEVCLREKQFSCWNKDDPNKHKLLNVSISDMLDCLHAAIEAIEEDELKQDLTRGATHYCTRDSHPKWAEGMAPVVTIGRHKFYHLRYF